MNFDTDKKTKNLECGSIRRFRKISKRLRKASTQFVSDSVAEAISLREYWNGDFTALTPQSDTKNDIVAYTLRLEQDRGVVLVFRRENAPSSFTVALADVSPDTEYDLIFSDEELKRTESRVNGSTLISGLEVNIEKAPGSLLIFYKANK